MRFNKLKICLLKNDTYYFFFLEILSVRNEQRGMVEKHKGGKKELISRVGVQAV